jgi:hypothetical protein
MAKIKHYKVPVNVKRSPGGDVSLTIDEDKMQFSKDEEIGTMAGGDILRVSKKIADDNSNEMLLAKRMLSSDQNEVTSFIIIKKLEE